METPRNIRYREEGKKNRVISAVGSFLFLGGVVGLLMAFSLHPPDPPLPLVEIVIEFESAPPIGGSGVPGAEEAQGGGIPEESPVSNMTQDFEDAPTTPDNPATSNPTVTENRPRITLPTFGNTPGGSTTPGGGSGTSTTPGPNGGGTSPTGVVGGTGLAGRRTTSRPEGISACQERGFIKVKIEVDPQGRVVKAEYQASGSTIATTVCKNDALKQAREWRFEADPDAKTNAVGVLTIEFK